MYTSLLIMVLIQMYRTGKSQLQLFFLAAYDMIFSGNPMTNSENRLKQRAYYIPKNQAVYTLLNSNWRFRYYSRDIDIEQKITAWDTIAVPSCWQSRGYENPNYTNKISLPNRSSLCAG